MPSLTIKTALLVSMMATGVNAANATTITFDEFKPDINHYAFTDGSTFATSGYEFSVTNGGVWFVDMSPFSNASRNGTTNLDLGATVSITNPSKRKFSVTSIDLATTLAVETSWIRLTGTHVNGTKTTELYTVNNAVSHPYGFNPTSLTNFTNLVSFEMQTVDLNPPSMAWYWTLVDNIVINEVPEPPTGALLGLGLAMIAGLARRKSIIALRSK